MPNYTQSSWISGGIRKDLIPLSSANSPVYKSGAEAIHNADILNPVGIERRGGFEFLAETTVSANKNTQLIRFQTKDGCYLLIIYDGGIEVFNCDGKKIDTITEYKKLKRYDADDPAKKTRKDDLVLQEVTWNFDDTYRGGNVGVSKHNVPVDKVVGSIPYSNDDIANINYATTKRAIYMVDGKHYPTQILYDSKTKKFEFSEMYIENGISSRFLEDLRNAVAGFEYKRVAYQDAKRGRVVENIQVQTGNVPNLRQVEYRISRKAFFDDQYDKDGLHGTSRFRNPYNILIGEHHVGFPKVVAIFDNRLIFASTENYPNYIWASIRDVVDSEYSYSNFTLSTEADGGIEKALSIGTGRITNIVHGRTMQVFTSDGVFTSTNNYISPVVGDFLLNKQTEHHLETDVRPVYENGRTLYIKGEMVEYLVYEYDAQRRSTIYNTYPLSQYANAIKNPLKMRYRESKNNNNTDQLFVLTDKKLIAINMSNVSSDTGMATSAGFVEWYTNGDVSTNKNSDKIIDIETFDSDLYLLINRSGKVFLEKANKSHDLDCSVRGTDVASLNGKLGHLDGKDVHVVYNNFIYNDQVVAGRLKSFTENSTEIEVGLGFYFRLESLPVRNTTIDILDDLDSSTKIEEFRYLLSNSLNGKLTDNHIKHPIDIVSQSFPIVFPPTRELEEHYIDKVQLITDKNKYTILQDEPMKLRLLMMKINFSKK